MLELEGVGNGEGALDVVVHHLDVRLVHADGAAGQATGLRASDTSEQAGGDERGLQTDYSLATEARPLDPPPPSAPAPDPPPPPIIVTW